MTEKTQEQIASQCDEWFSKHIIKSRGEHHVFLGQPGTVNMSCAISLAGGRHLSVIGDIDPVVFSYYNGPSLAGAIGWMAKCGGPDSYVYEKARIGMGGGAWPALQDYDGDLFEKDARAEIDELLKGYDDDPPAVSWDGFEENRSIEFDREHLIHSEFYEYLDELGICDHSEWVYELGYRPSRRLHTAHAALRRAHAILSGENDNG